MIKYGNSTRRRVSDLETMREILQCQFKRNWADRYTFFSKQPEFLQINLRSHRHCSPLVRHQWPSLFPAILVCQTTALLDTKGVGAGLRGVVACISKSAEGQCQYTDMGGCLWHDSAACWGGSGGRVGLGEGTTAGKAKDEDGCRSYGWERGWEERALAVGGVVDCIWL